ncbi:hypothetical protein E2562_011921 [Oryza meyeriana var. granulata]|uniref:Uncharacterized protein n=1 Tax=Oryza meyeriana var. granulata TaxID=110450 RepID=A0A6G1CEE4_9ORYZ|nr:hypothetical protein E2562_011921 [Oryza meyeriana var. granulata]
MADGRPAAATENRRGAGRLDGIDGGWRSPATAMATGRRHSAGAVAALCRSGDGRLGTNEDRRRAKKRRGAGGRGEEERRRWGNTAGEERALSDGGAGATAGATVAHGK